MLRAVLVCCLGLLAISASAQTISMQESLKQGDCFGVEIDLQIKGTLSIQGAPKDATGESMEARANHQYAETIQTLGTNGQATRVARWYTVATGESMVAGARSTRKLPAEKKLILLDPTSKGTNHLHPSLLLNRDELDLISEHFDSLVLPQLLPTNAVAKDETWALPDNVATTFGLLDALTKNELVAKLSNFSDATAEFRITGALEGIELGAVVKMTVTAKVTFDRQANRVVGFTSELAEEREAGPISPRMSLKANLTLKRALATTPAELKAVTFPVAGKATEQQLNLRHDDPNGKYSIVYPRDWHTTGQTGDYWVIRLLEQGEWVAQATLLTLKPTADGTHMSPAEFKAAIAKQSGWVPSLVAADGEIPIEAGRWLYRVTATGKQDGLAVVQSFFLLAGPKGEQVVVTIVAKEDKLAKLGTRDVSLVQAITFPAK